MLGIVGLMVALSYSVTKTVDLLRNAVSRLTTWEPDASIVNITALAVGIGFELGEFSQAVNFAPSLVALVPRLAPYASQLNGTSGELLSGIIIGSLAGFAHDLTDALSSSAKASRAKAGTPTVGDRAKAA